MNIKKFVLIIIFSFSSIYSQGKWSVELGGGILSPSNGETGNGLQSKINFMINDNLSTYISSGYFNWNYIRRTIGNNNGLRVFEAERKHKHIPILLGSELQLLQYKQFKLLGMLELGINILSYDKINYMEFITYENKLSTIGIDTDLKSTKLLLGIGSGITIVNTISDIVDISLTAKIQSFGNSDYEKFGSSNSYYNSIIFGVKRKF